MQEKRGFFDKINNAFFMVVDVFLSVLEDRGWNIPEETRFLYHTAIFVFLLWLGFPLIIKYFLEFEALIIIFTVISFYSANIMPIRKLLGYYSSPDKIHNLVNKIKNNQVSIKEVSEHLHKNLMPPNLTLSIIRAYQAKSAEIPPELIRALIRQPQEITIFKEIIKQQLNESDFSLLMRKYKNKLPKELLLKTIESQKMNPLTIKDLLFFQENAYQVAREIARKADNAVLTNFVMVETARYKEKMLRKNFLRSHHLALSVAAATLAGMIFIPFITDLVILAGLFAIAWLIVFEVLYNYAIRALYFKI